MLNLDYDKKFDILYARFPFTGHSYGEESDDGVITFHNISNDSITGIAIYDFKKRYEKGTLPFLSINIDLSSSNVKSLIYS